MLNVRIYLQDRLTSFRMILLSFILFIFTGALLLSLPCASVGSGGVSFLDALFTSTSAACVTGLVVFDTATKWTLFGRIVLINEEMMTTDEARRITDFLAGAAFALDGKLLRVGSLKAVVFTPHGVALLSDQMDELEIIKKGSKI